MARGNRWPNTTSNSCAGNGCNLGTHKTWLILSHMDTWKPGSETVTPKSTSQSNMKIMKHTIDVIGFKTTFPNLTQSLLWPYATIKLWHACGSPRWVCSSRERSDLWLQRWRLCSKIQNPGWCPQAKLWKSTCFHGFPWFSYENVGFPWFSMVFHIPHECLITGDLWGRRVCPKKDSFPRVYTLAAAFYHGSIMDWQDSCHWDDDPCLNKQAGKNQRKELSGVFKTCCQPNMPSKLFFLSWARPAAHDHGKDCALSPERRRRYSWWI